MEDLLLNMYNQNLANKATNLYDQRQRDLINKAAMDVFSTGFQNKGILNTQPAMAFNDFYSPVYEPYDPEKDDEQVSYSELVGRPSFSDRISKFAKNIIGQPGISSLIGFFNPLAGAVSKGLGYLGRNLNPSFVGPKGARPYGSESNFGIFARSNTLADVFQNMRDKKARDEAAARGAAKQRAAKDKARMDAFRAFKDSKPSGGGGSGGGIGSSSGGAASPGSQGPGGSDAMGSS
jgi:hypothetical protein